MEVVWLVIWRERIQESIYSMIPVLYDMCIEKYWIDINRNVNGNTFWVVDYRLLFFSFWIF